MPLTWSSDGFELLFRLLYPRVVRASELFLGDRAAAEDVAQEAFTRLLVRPPMPADGAERWVFRVARNLAFDRMREVRRLLPIQAESADPARQAGTEAPEVSGPINRREGWEARTEALRAAVAALPKRQREVVGLRIYGELSYEAIATAVGRSLGAVKQELFRAKAALRVNMRGLEMEDHDDG
jgi:RNA polymerase sigma-70 factor (ECF subfamily)